MALVPASSRGGGWAQPSQWTVDATTGSLTITGPSGGGADSSKLPQIILTDPDSPGELRLSYGRNNPAISLLLGADVDGAVLRPGGGLAAYTNDLFKVWKKDGTDIAYFDGNTYQAIVVNAAPADGAISAGELMLWFDSTNGASKLMVKAKQADGTIKAASVALA